LRHRLSWVRGQRAVDIKSFWLVFRFFICHLSLFLLVIMR
jgi:hypothetical protein